MNPFRPPGRAEVEHTPIRAELPTAKTAGAVATIRLYEPIDSWGGYWGVSAKEFAQVLDSLPDDISEIRLLINSPGGEVWEGIAIMNALRSHPAKVTAVVEGLAASSASFIAAAADELVMMQNSELYIHNAWGVVVGDAADLRTVADDLENHYDRNIASVYAAKTGDSVEHWLAEMDKDRFLTADEAVAEKLADRVEGVGDAAAAKARFDLSVLARRDKPAAPATASKKSPAEPGTPNRKENVVEHDAFVAGIRERLGMTDADATDETVLAALDEALQEQPDDTPAPIADQAPAGTVLVEAAQFEQLQIHAKAGVTALAQLDAQRRDSIVQAAIESGRIAPAARDTWRAQLDANEEGTSKLLASLPANTIPVAEVGHSDDTQTEDERLYAAAWGNAKEVA